MTRIRITRWRRWPAGGVCGLLCVGVGCQAMYFLTPEVKQQVPAEYNQLGNQKVAVVVWAEPATLDFDPFARFRVCKSVTYYLRKNLRNARLVEPSDVNDLQERLGGEWESLSNRELGQRLNCDLVLRVDLLEYTDRAPDAPAWRKGRVRGTINLFDCRADAASGSALYQTEVAATWPPRAQQGALDDTEASVMHRAVEQFGMTVARKFYDHEVSHKQTDRE